jgi:hypothetical protein
MRKKIDNGERENEVIKNIYTMIAKSKMLLSIVYKKNKISLLK